ncbi:DegT/DnrJ/EryC1/StrS family aminotransferase [Candidatus Uhrbacteria bacterium]|nr:DegT/DnrJ/EryC1/StrS family aminotransferase [Candidatus Uhrbacteria bacterium]
MPPMFHKRALELRLAEMHRRRYCIVTSRGTVAIFLALQSLGSEQGCVIIPAIICPSVVNAIVYAGFTPEFCDVRLRDFNLDPVALERALKTQKAVRAVLLPHLYGHPTDIDRIRELTRSYRVPLIEDVAQALGGSYNGSPLGSFGDFSILSFGHTKILDAGGGGAVLFDSEESFDRIRALARRLPQKANDYHQLETIYRRVYYTLAPLIRERNELSFLYSSFPWIFRNLFLFRDVSPTLVERIYSCLPLLPAIVKKRNEYAAHYRAHLNHEAITHPLYVGQGVYWRYSFLVRGNRQYEIAQAIRKRGVEVSNWYPPVHRFYQVHPEKLKHSEYVGDHMFNIWVDPRYTRKDINRTVQAVLRSVT